MINAKEATTIILDSVRSLGTKTVSFERSLGLVLADDIVSDENIPSFDNSGMDGFAIRSEDTLDVPTILHIIAEIPAGTISGKTITRGECAAIMTGAKIPSGCDAVIQHEWTEQVSDASVRLLRSVSVGQNIRHSGDDIQKGSIVLERGHKIRPQEIGVLASLGKQFVSVYRPPTVAVLATGNELVEINKQVSDGKIRNSNLYALKALLQELGCDVLDLGIGKDHQQELKEKIAQGLQADMLITTGGVSVGKFDFVMDVLSELGVEQKFWKVNIKPGMPLCFGNYCGKPVFGLPGNPVSTFVTFIEFVKPAIQKMFGLKITDNKFRIRAMLDNEIVKKDGKRHFVRGILESKNGTFVVRTTGTQSSNVLTSLTKANCLIHLSEEKELFRMGDNVEVELL